MKRGCTQCGECLRVCPVYALMKREEYSPKGKRILMEPLDPEFGNGLPVPGELLWERVRRLSRLCAGCGRCARVCARKLSTAELLADARSRNPHWTQFVWQMWIRHLGKLWPMAGRMAMLIPRGIGSADLAGIVSMAQALVARPAPAPWFTLAPMHKVASQRVMVFPGCTARYARPAWTNKATKLLAAWGYVVMDGSDFVCCGGTLHHAGAYESEARVRERNLQVWKSMGKAYVVTFCASCLHSLRSYAKHMRSEDEAFLWQERVLPLSRLLTDPVVTKTADVPLSVGYHEPCHWDGKDEDMSLLAKALQVQKGAGACCGMGGILKMSDAGLSAAMAGSCLARMPEDIREILTGCSGCVLQLSGEAGSKRTVRHWLDVCDTES